MAHIRRQELKHDEFVDSVEETLLWIEDHARALVILAVVVVVGGGSFGGFYWYSKKQEAKAAAALTEAMDTYNAPVQAGLPALPGEGPDKTFSTQQEKDEASVKAFEAVREKYPRTRSGRIAQHYEALCQFDLGKKDEAVKSLQDLSRSSDRNIAAVAKLALAGFERELGKPDEAAKLLQELADHPTPTVPRATALLELATLKADTDPEMARKFYTDIKNEFPDTPIAAEVTRRLELLPPPATSVPEPAPASTSGSQP